MHQNAQETYDYLCEVPAISFQEVINSDQWEVMQYTGLKDRNGVEIYENDMLSFLVGGQRYPHLVEFEKGQFIAGIPLFVIEEKHQAEVIGNIYENPELLKQT